MYMNLKNTVCTKHDESETLGTNDAKLRHLSTNTIKEEARNLSQDEKLQIIKDVDQESVQDNSYYHFSLRLGANLCSNEVKIQNLEVKMHVFQSSKGRLPKPDRTMNTVNMHDYYHSVLEPNFRLISSAKRRTNDKTNDSTYIMLTEYLISATFLNRFTCRIRNHNSKPTTTYVNTCLEQTINSV